MIDYDSFSRCHLTDIFFRFSRRSKRVKLRISICKSVAEIGIFTDDDDENKRR